jgi:SRSO17 transposase
MGGRLVEGPTMARTTLDWEAELRGWLEPFLERLGHKARRLHHFIAGGVWDLAPLERELLIQADRLVGGSDAVLVIDDTAVPKKGKSFGRCCCAICFGTG